LPLPSRHASLAVLEGRFMNRSFAALLASLSLLLATPALAAKAKGHAPAAAPARVTIAPGVTIMVPHGWVACDKETNAVLGNVWNPANITSLKCEAPRYGETQVHVLNPAPLNPLSVIGGYQKYQALNPTLLKEATPDMVSQLSAEECKDASSILTMTTESIASCSYTVQTIAQHPAFVGTVVVNMPQPRDPTHVVRIFMIPYGRENFGLQFEMPGKTASASSHEVDAILQSLTIDPAVEAAAVVPPPVAISPAPGLTLSIPAGWIACDTPTNALLGAPAGTEIVRQQSCGKMVQGQTLLAFSPALLLNISVGVIYAKDAAISQRQVERMDADDLEKFTTEQCPNITKPVTEENGTVQSCTFSTEQIAGHTALKSVLVATGPGDGPLQSELAQTYYIPYGQGYLTLLLDAPKLTQSYSQPVLDAVIKSVTIQ
jgi:hypothetical protein